MHLAVTALSMPMYAILIILIIYIIAVCLCAQPTHNAMDLLTFNSTAVVINFLLILCL
jgi:hypothetical protein